MFTEFLDKLRFRLTAVRYIRLQRRTESVRKSLDLYNRFKEPGTYDFGDVYVTLTEAERYDYAGFFKEHPKLKAQVKFKTVKAATVRQRRRAKQHA